jgi:hypothetical protein
MANQLGYNGGRFYSSLVQPVLIDCNFIVDSANGNGLGIRSLKGSLVKDVFMYTSATPGVGNSGITNPMGHTASEGFVWVKLKENYQRYVGGFYGFVSPSTGAAQAINGSALTVGSPYFIASVGHAAAGTVTIAPVADVSGSLASTWFKLFDGYGNTFIIWFYVTGVGGAAPVGTGGILVQQTIAENASASTIGTALASTIALLPSGVSGVYSFTTSGSSTVTAVSTQVNPYGPVAGPPSDGSVPTGFTFAQTIYNTNQYNWNAVGLPKGVVPSVGGAFIATATGSSSGGGSTGTAIAPGISGISSIEVVGDPNQTIAPVPMGGICSIRWMGSFSISCSHKLNIHRLNPNGSCQWYGGLLELLCRS